MALAVLTRRVIMTAASQAKLTSRQSWKELAKHYESIRNMHLRTLFADDPKRGERFTLEAAGLSIRQA
jgi:glucose-6-phosphate isomerase